MRRASWSAASISLALAVVLSLLTTSIADAAPPAGERYIVVFKDDVDVDVAVPAVAKAHGLTVGHVYRHALKGMSVTAPEGRLNALERNPNVAYVEVDDVVQLAAHAIPTGIRRINATTNSNLDIDGTDDYRVDVDVAVIDTGVDFQHPDLNVAGGVDCTLTSGGGPPWARQNYCSSTEGTGGDDDHYHGTHVAGTVGALDNDFGVVGVAPGARIWAVKVLNSSGSGYESGIVAGIDWITARGDIEVANMSLGGIGHSQAEYDAIQGAVDTGVAFAVAAGNNDADADGYSPARFDNVLTVSALADFDGLPGALGSPTCRADQDDTLADFSNWGLDVDIAAPGVCILSTYPLEQGSYGTISGTSMASPHAAGALALLASINPPSTASAVYDLYDRLVDDGNFDWTDDSGDTKHEPLLDLTGYNAARIPAGGAADNPPTVSISSPVDGASFGSNTPISFAGTASDNEDGNISAGLSWTSDLDGLIGGGAGFEATLSDGTHTVTASVTDSGGNTSSDSVTVTVTVSSPGGSISLSASGYKIKGNKYVDLTWAGASSVNVEIYRNGSPYATTANDGLYTAQSLGKGGGSDSFRVCEAGTTNCSNTVTVIW
ncbi:MAG: S8 family serine peptidase [Acidimicrobiia bacterium]|nr:S8 family serine peptidase [Acidimicrobiia bacterium]